MKIWVVEDEAPIRDVISINLQLVGYEVFTAEDGIMAEEFLEKQRVDLILLDVMIPGIDGFSLIEKIKKHNTPVIFVTAKESVLDRVKGLRLGADDYIIKPFETMELLARIEVVLRRYNKNDNHIKFKNIEVDTKQRIVKLNNGLTALALTKENTDKSFVATHHIYKLGANVKGYISNINKVEHKLNIITNKISQWVWF